MPVNYISDVTKSVINLIKLEWRRLEDSDLRLFPLPLEKLSEGDMSLFLYHVQENTHHRNGLPIGNDSPPVQVTPMPLNLYFQLGVKYGDNPNEEVFYEGQKKMSVAIKALHDYPELTDNTRVKDPTTNTFVPVFSDSIKGRQNKFRICLQPKPETDAVHYWTAGTSPLAWAAYYEISTVFLEPEKAKTYAGRVLQYGNFVFPESAPRITQSQNTLEFNLPAGGSQKVTVQPAQAPYEDTIDFFGAGFSGDTMELLLSHGRWDKPVRANDWELAIIKEGHIRVKVKGHAVRQEGGATVAVLPGLYAAQIRVARSRALPDGTVRQFSHTSNQFPITVSPQIGTPNLAGGVITVNGKIFQHAELKDEDVEVYLGETRFPRDGTLGSGTFRITGPETMEIKLPASYPGSWAPGEHIPLRILVNGAESPPRWIQIP